MHRAIAWLGWKLLHLTEDPTQRSQWRAFLYHEPIPEATPEPPPTGSPSAAAPVRAHSDGAPAHWPSPEERKAQGAARAAELRRAKAGNQATAMR